MPVFVDLKAGLWLMIRSPLTYLVLVGTVVTATLILEGLQLQALPLGDPGNGPEHDIMRLLSLRWLLDQALFLALAFIFTWLFVYFVVMAAARQIVSPASSVRGFLSLHHAPMVSMFFALVLTEIVVWLISIAIGMVMLGAMGQAQVGGGTGTMETAAAYLLLFGSEVLVLVGHSLVLSWYLVKPLTEAMHAVRLPATMDLISLRKAARPGIFRVHLVTGLIGSGLIALLSLAGGTGQFDNALLFLEFLFTVALPAVASVTIMAAAFRASDNRVTGCGTTSA